MLTYNGELKLVPYHQISAGQTRDGETAFHNEEYAYLKAVDSNSDKTAPGYLNSTYIAKQQLPVELRIVEREDSGYVVSLMADENILEAESFVTGMGIASSDFSMQKTGEQVRFLSKGIGHGLGFDGYYKKLNRTVYFAAFWTPCKYSKNVTADKRCGHETIMSRGEKNMTKGRIAKYVANTALLAVLAAAGIGVYQLGTSGKDESVPEIVPSYYDESLSTENSTDNAVDAGTSLVEAELESNISTDHTSEKGMSQTEGEDAGSETTEAGSSSTESTFTSESILSAEQSTNESGTVNTSASVQEAPKLSFSEDTLMEWPVDGNILMDYNMDQTVYFPTLDQYKLSPAIAVQAVEGAPVLASVPGTVYSIEENAQTGTTVTMEIGSGYQAIYGQLTDLTVQEGDTVKEGEVIGYIGQPTKYYSKEGSNLYFAMKKDGEPVDPIAYLP